MGSRCGVQLLDPHVGVLRRGELMLVGDHEPPWIDHASLAVELLLAADWAGVEVFSMV